MAAGVAMANLRRAWRLSLINAISNLIKVMAEISVFVIYQFSQCELSK